MIRYSVLGSGSSGNSYVISHDKTALLFDFGFSLREITTRLLCAGIDFSSIQALFITHLHPDHCRGAGVFARKTKLPVYVHTRLSTMNIPELNALNIPPHQLFGCDFEIPIHIGPFVVQAFPTSHDSPFSSGFSITVDQRHFLLLTDTGIVTEQMKTLATDADVMFLEANYEARMLEQGPYPRMLKQRIAGTFGHLSNYEALHLLSASQGCNGRCRKVYLCHLSKVNNSVEILQERLVNLPPIDAEITVCHHGLQYEGEIE